MSTVKTPDDQANSKVGTAVAESSCQKPIAIYPVRYSVAHCENICDLDGKTYDASTLTKTFSKLENSLYTLRALRPETYVYIYNENSSNKLNCFFYSSAVGNTDLPRFYWMIKDGTDFVPLKSNPSDCIWVRNETGQLPKSIRFGCTDAPISHRVWDELNSKANLRSQLLPTEVPLQPWIDACKKAKTEFKKAEELDPKTDQIFPVSDLEKQVLDFTEEDLDWSEQGKVNINAASVKASMQIVNPDAQIVMALHDPIGLARELNNITAQQNAKAVAFIAEKNHEITSAKSILAYLENVHSPEVVEAKIKQKQEYLMKGQVGRGQVHPNRFRSNMSRVAANVRADFREEKQRLLKHLRVNESGLNAAISKYHQDLSNITQPIDKMIKDQLVWIDSKNPSYVNIHNALHFYDGYHDKQVWHTDLTYAFNAYAYEQNILLMHSSLNLNEIGKKQIETLLLKNPDDSVYWKAIAKGNKKLWEHIQKPLSVTESLLNVLSKSSEWGFNPNSIQTLSALALMAKPVLIQNATVPVYSGKAFMLRATLTSRLSQIVEPAINSMSETIANEYVLSWDTTTNDRRLPKSQRKGASTDKIKQMVIDEVEQIQHKNLNVKTKSVEIVSWRKVKAGAKTFTVPDRIIHTYYNPAQNPLSSTYKFLSSDKAGGAIAGAIAFITVFDIHKNLTHFNTTKDKKDQAFIALASSLTGFASGIFALTELGIKHFEHQGNLKFRKSLAPKFSGRAINANFALRGAILLGAVSSTLGSIQDGNKAIDSYQKGDKDSAAWRAGASALGATGAVASLGAGAAMGVFGTAAGSLGAQSAAMALAVMGPMGWVALGVIALVGVIYCAWKAGKAADRPEEIWLKRSYWGVRHNHDFATEQATLRGVFFRPTVSASWDDDLFDPDKLEITVFLPQYQPGKSELEVVHSATLDGRLLSSASNANLINNKSSENQYHYKRELINSGAGYANYKLTFTVNDDAKPNVRLWYYPNKLEQPNLKIEGSASGNIWVFENDGWSNTIDDAEFVIVEDK